MLKISIVTICYNEAEKITTTLASVAGQTYPNIEDVVKDGGLTDGTDNVVQQYTKNR